VVDSSFKCNNLIHASAPEAQWQGSQWQARSARPLGHPKTKRRPGKGARNIRSAVTSRRPCGAQSNWGYGSSGRALRACHWLPSFPACRREFVLVNTVSVGKPYYYRLRAVLDSFLETSV